MNYKNTAYQILRDKVNKQNIDTVLKEWNDFTNKKNRKNINNLVKEIDEALLEIKSDLLISINVDKEPYEKIITNDNVINITGQSGAGKTYYANKHLNNNLFLLIDTDDIFSDKRYQTITGINKELGDMFRKKYQKLPNLYDDFDLIYQEILDYCKNKNKTIVIDCAQYHCIKNINLLKGKIVIIRTCIDKCYQRCIDRYIKQNKNYTEEELINYKNRKQKIYNWYKESNKFILKIDKL